MAQGAKNGAAGTAPDKETTMARKPSGMHAEDIKADLRKKWGSLSALSRHFGKNPNIVTQVISTPGYSVPMEIAIAAELGIPPHEVWPDRFHSDGTPIPMRVDRTPTRSAAQMQRANGVAA